MHPSPALLLYVESHSRAAPTARLGTARLECMNVTNCPTSSCKLVGTSVDICVLSHTSGALTQERNVLLVVRDKQVSTWEIWENSRCKLKPTDIPRNEKFNGSNLRCYVPTGTGRGRVAGFLSVMQTAIRRVNLVEPSARTTLKRRALLRLSWFTEAQSVLK
jgi:hypothetical protein